MTWLQGLLVKVLMLAVTVGVLYWAVNPEMTAEPEQSAAVLPPAADALDGGEQGEAPQAQPEAQARPVQAAAVSSPARPAPPPRRAVTFPLDLNRARVDELMELPGIGEKLAQRMVDYRKSQGGFRSVDDLRKVRGIGAKRMERLRPLVMTAEVP